MELTLNAGRNTSFELITHSDMFGFFYLGNRYEITSIGTYVELIYTKIFSKCHTALLLSNNSFKAGNNLYKYCLLHRLPEKFQILSGNC